MTGGVRFIQPCCPIRAKDPPAGDGWLHELKIDGYRLQVVKSGRQVRLYSRRGNDWTQRMPVLVDALAALPTPTVVLDAELFLPGTDGTPNFYGLQAAISARQHELAIFAFDILHKDGIDLRPLQLVQRKLALTSLIERSKIPCLKVVQSFPDGTELLASAERLGLEGVDSKRRSAPYRSGECRDWRNTKTDAWREANRERG